MKNSKRYLFFLLLLAAVLLKFNMDFSGSRTVTPFRGAQLEEEVWNPLIASSVNDNLLSLVVDNKEYTNENNPFYMDENLNIMLPVDMLREALNCSVHLYDEKELLVEKHSEGLLFTLGADEVLVNGEQQESSSPFIKKDGRYYVSLTDILQYLGYSYSWDISQNLASAADTSEGNSIIPLLLLLLYLLYI